MRYSIMRSGKIGTAVHVRPTLEEAVALAVDFMADSTPGLATSIIDNEQGVEFNEVEISEMAERLPPRSRSMFGGDDA